ncbi:MAG: glycosyltransferase family 39 protein [Deltaproteobacteria bacterium]|nr:glycosyltransferase family 39 protein [Deltaproteobacteria bacterium]
MPDNDHATHSVPADVSVQDAYWRYAALAVLAVGAAIRLWVWSWPLDRLLPTFVADDTFYYSQIAKNLLAGHGLSFDGVIETNGFHPLWMIPTLLVTAVLGDDPTRVLRGLLLLEIAFGAAGAWLLFTIARRHVAPGVAFAPVLAVLFWALNPFVLGTEMMGVEAPLALVTHLTALLLYLDWRTEADSNRRLIAIGAALGLAFLSRTDHGLLGVIVLSFIVLRPVEGATGADAWRRRWQRAWRVGVTAWAVVLPWLAFNLAKFGTIWQDSGKVLAFRGREAVTDETVSALDSLTASFRQGFYDQFLRLTGGVSVFWIVLGIGVALGLVFAVRGRGEKVAGRVPWPMVLFATFIWGFYSLYFGTQKFWYFPPITALMALLIARVGAFIPHAFTGRTARRVAIGVTFVFVGANLALNIPKVIDRGFHPWQNVYLQVSREVANGQANWIGPDDVIGAFNSGIIGAYAGRRVVNLDGVVNPRILEAMKEKRFVQALREMGVTVVIDHQGVIVLYQQWSAPDAFKGFKLLHKYETPVSAGDVIAVRVPPAKEDAS